MSKACSLCQVSLGLDQFRGRSRRCIPCKAVTDMMHRRALSADYRMSYLDTARDDVLLRRLKHAFERDRGNFSFQEWYGVDLSDTAIRACDAQQRRVRQRSAPPPPPPPPPGAPPMAQQSLHVSVTIVHVSVTSTSPAATANMQTYVHMGGL